MNSFKSSPHAEEQDPYQLLGVTRQSSPEDVKKAYHKAMSEYHPDKVEHLGEDLKVLAKRKTEAIIKAYNEIR